VNQAHDLLEWSNSPDFDSYVENWLSLGTSGRMRDVMWQDQQGKNEPDEYGELLTPDLLS
jgi:hypothetical protein